MIENLLLLAFGGGALASAALMIVLHQPMRVALALISTMICLGVVYGLLGVHFIAAFQVLIYVGAVMVFMVYAIMLLEVRDAASARFSRLLLPGLLGFVLLVGVLGISLWRGAPPAQAAAGTAGFGISAFSATFLDAYWLHFELTSVLLLAAVVAALAVIRVSREASDKANHG